MIVLTGDTHREFDRVFDFCEEYGTTPEDILIVLGDAGINYYLDESDQMLKQELSRLPVTLLCIHGNHEERPAEINTYEERPWRDGVVYVEPEFPSLLFAKDGEIYDLDGQRVMVIGGAYSVDKFSRLCSGAPWFPSEQLDEKIKCRVEARLEKAEWQVDCVLSHTVLLPYMPLYAFLPGIDQEAKGALHRLSDPRFPENYLGEILKAERLHRFVLIPTNIDVICRLQNDYGRKVLLCYPNDACREEYRARFIARGNSQSFLELFIDDWDRFLGAVRQNREGVHIVMGPGEHLMDLRQRFEEERRTDPSVPASPETIHALEQEGASCRKDSALYLFGSAGSCLYSITDLDAPEEREFLHRIGKMAFRSGIGAAVVPKDFLWVETPDTCSTKDHTVVEAFVKKCRHRFFEG